MNREEIENLVVEATGRSDKLTFIRSAINISVRKFASEHLWSDLMTEGEVTVSAGSASASLASDVARVTEARIMDGTSSRPLIVRPKTWLIQRIPDPASRTAGRPCYAYLQGTELFIIPYPDVEYDINYTYYKMHPLLTASTSEVLVRLGDNAVLAHATYLTFKAIEKHEDAAQWMATYNEEVRTAKKLDKGNSITQHIADQHRSDRFPPGEYWLDPFQMESP